jgi:hypothetical protein
VTETRSRLQSKLGAAVMSDSCRFEDSNARLGKLAKLILVAAEIRTGRYLP